MNDPFSAEKVGGKAANLERLRAAGWRVPAFHVLPGADFDAQGRLIEDAAPAHEAALAALEGERFAVRSSAIDEDGADNSFAGQFLSLLDVPRGEILAAATRVWRSGAEASVAAYRAQRGSGGHAAPSVIVQTMIDPRAAGVIFSADPVTSRTDRMVVSAVAGLGEKLMAGEEDGWTHVLDAATGAVIEETPGEGASPLTAADIAVLRDAAARIADQFGAHQDIEFAFDSGGLHILQARPITTLAEGNWRIWDNSNIVESYPGWVSPLTFSFARSVYAQVYRQLLADLGAPKQAIADRHAAFEGLLGRFSGRVYYELGNWHRLLSALPAYRLNAGFMDQMMGVDEPLPAPFIAALEQENGKGGRFGAGLRMAGAGLGLFGRALVLTPTIRRFRARLDDALDPARIDFATADLDTLVAHWRDLERRLLSRWDAPLLNDLLCMMAVGAARKALGKWGGAEGTALFNATLIGQGEIVSAEPPRRIRAMAAIARTRPDIVNALRESNVDALLADPVFGQELAAYIEDFGDRCIAELKLESPTLEDDPSSILSAVLAATARREDTQDANETPDLHAVMQGKPVRRVIARVLLTLAARRVRDRENLRFDRTRVFGRVRRIVRAMGAHLEASGRLARADDVFLLTVEELQSAVEGWGTTRDLAALVDTRRTEALADVSDNPPERFETRGALLDARPIVTGKKPIETGDTRTGLGCSAGKVTAIARVILDPARGSVGPGEVLVARNTDPGWIALFASAGAVVVEKGSILSHSAIVAREMGIPCVVGIKGVTEWIADGETIMVDGGAGSVRILR